MPTKPIAVATLAVAAGCGGLAAPLPPPTTVALNSRDPGAVDLALDAGGSTGVYGTGQVTAEPFVGFNTSLPVSISVGSTGLQTHAVGRLGARHRFTDRIALGAALGPAFVRTSADLGRADWWAAYADVEFVWGRTSLRTRHNVTLRPGLSTFHDRLGLAVPLGASFGRRLGRFVTASVSCWGGVRLMIPRPDHDTAQLRGTPEFGLTFSMSGHVPRGGKVRRPRVLIDV